MPQANNAFKGVVATAWYTEVARLTSWSDTSSLGGNLTWKTCCAWSDSGVIVDHSFENVAEVPASCNSQGVIAHRRCTVCGLRMTNYGALVTGDAMLTIPKTAHSYGEPTFRRTQDGQGFEAAFTCGTCQTETVVTATVNGEPAVTPPTCTEPGKATYALTASLDGASYQGSVEEPISAGGHSYGEPTFRRTQDGQGFEAAFTCGICQIVTVVTATLNGEPTVTPPTCTEPGKTTYALRASLDGASYQGSVEEPISAGGHSYGEPTFRRTQDGQGFEAAFTCGTCQTETVVTATVNGEPAVTQPTCTELGKTTYALTASLDGATYQGSVEEPISTTAHTPEKLPAVPATLTSTGLTEGERCAVCHQILTAQQVIPMLPLLTPDFVVPASLKTLGAEAFAGIDATAVLLQGEPTTIGERAFAGCKKLIQIQIPGSVTEIGDNAFDGCPDQLLIVGKAGSAAEDYARENDIRFRPAD